MILAPEDGTTSETITMPSAGVGKVIGFHRHVHLGTVYSNSSTAFTVGQTVSYTPKKAGSRLYVLHHNWYRTAGSAAECRSNWWVYRNGVELSGYHGAPPGQYDYDNSGGIWLLNNIQQHEEYITPDTSTVTWDWKMASMSNGQGNGGTYWNEGTFQAAGRISQTIIWELDL